MNRRKFIGTAAAMGASSFFSSPSNAGATRKRKNPVHELKADLVVVGGGLGGCSAALAALKNGLSVILTEETDWIGGQLTQQGVPPDEHRWIESFGCTRSYRNLRSAIREYYRSHYPLTADAKGRPNLNPGDGSVSRLCHEPRVGLAVLESLFAPFLSRKSFTLLLNTRVTAAETNRDRIASVSVKSSVTGHELVLRAPIFIDGTELGDLLPITGTEFVIGSESQKDTGEPHAGEKADPQNQQAFTVCFAMDHVPGENHVIERPPTYQFWRDFVPRLKPEWPGKLLNLTYTHPASLEPRKLGFNPEGGAHDGIVNLWIYRRLIHRLNFNEGAYSGDICLVNWPQNDYLLGNLLGVEPSEARGHVQKAKELSLCLLYWLQTEAPRLDGKQGWPGLRLRPDVLGTEDGLAKYPYVRESRRIKAEFTVLEQHVSLSARMAETKLDNANVTAAPFADSVGVGHYQIDLHPTSRGDNYIDFPALPFEIPLGALLPVRMENLLPVAKNIGTTHITNGCYRLHPVEWNIGESAGLLAAFAARRKVVMRAVRQKAELFREYQKMLHDHGVETRWPEKPF